MNGRLKSKKCICSTMMTDDMLCPRVLASCPSKCRGKLNCFLISTILLSKGHHCTKVTHLVIRSFCEYLEMVLATSSRSFQEEEQRDEFANLAIHSS